MLEEGVGEWGPGLLEALRGMEDPRKPKGVRHPLAAVVAPMVRTETRPPHFILFWSWCGRLQQPRGRRWHLERQTASTKSATVLIGINLKSPSLPKREGQDGVNW